MSGDEKTVIDVSQLESLRELNEDEDEDIVTELIDIFVKHSPETLRLLEEAIHAQDRVQVVKLAHKLKGSCANLGAEYMRELCQHLEEKGNALTWEEIAESLTSIRNAYSELVQILERDWRKPAA